MTVPYTTAAPGATARRNSPHHSIRPRNRFARAARNKAFRARDLSLAREPGFVDRQPDQPVRLGDVATEVVADVGQRALRHWLNQAAQAEGEEREVALQIAKEIAAMIGVPWTDVMSGKAA